MFYIPTYSQSIIMICRILFTIDRSKRVWKYNMHWMVNYGANLILKFWRIDDESWHRKWVAAWNTWRRKSSSEDILHKDRDPWPQYKYFLFRHFFSNLLTVTLIMLHGKFRNEKLQFDFKTLCCNMKVTH